MWERDVFRSRQGSLLAQLHAIVLMSPPPADGDKNV